MNIKENLRYGIIGLGGPSTDSALIKCVIKCNFVVCYNLEPPFSLPLIGGAIKLIIFLFILTALGIPSMPTSPVCFFVFGGYLYPPDAFYK